jgi:flagellar basal-body rod modification protein FlgD
MVEVSSALPSGIRTYEDLQPEVESGNSALGQEDFLTLMTTQLKNQDPFAPMENGEFLAQMAQFSTVSGLDTINETLQDLKSQLGGDRLSTASSLLGKQMLVQGTTARPDSNGEIHGTIDVPTDGTVSVRYTNASTGATVFTQDLGKQDAGEMSFSWTDVPASVTDARQALKLSVMVTNDSGTVLATPSVYAKVTGVTVPEAGATDFTLQVEDYGVKNSMEISALR